jgi:ribosomal protein L37E
MTLTGKHSRVCSNLTKKEKDGLKRKRINLMEKMERCSECGVPRQISDELEWGDNGVISLVGSRAGRMVFYESRIIDNLFKGIEELIGLPVEHIVMESRRREAKRFCEKRVPLEVRRELQAVMERMERGEQLDEDERRAFYGKCKAITMGVIGVGSAYGYGRSSLDGSWEEGTGRPWRTNIVSNPYSLPFWAAGALGAIEALDGTDMWASYEEIGDDRYRVTAYPAPHPLALKERLQAKCYPFKPGDIVHERCSSCGLPLKVAHYQWDLEEGIITDPDNGRRMAIYSPTSLEAVLGDLEMELGEAIPAAVIEAQRRYVKSRVGDDNWRRGEWTFRHLTAVRGLGNLTRFEVDEHRLDVTIENACLPLIMVGMAKAIYELALGYDETTHEWGVNEEGDLNITVKA